MLADPLALLADHAFLEQKAANNAMELMTRWPSEWFPGWLEAMTSVARDEAAHLAQVMRLLIKRGGRMGRGHRNPYARALRTLVRKGGEGEIVDRLIVSALIEVRSLRALRGIGAGLRRKGISRVLRGAVFLRNGALQIVPEAGAEGGAEGCGDGAVGADAGGGGADLRGAGAGAAHALGVAILTGCGKRPGYTAPSRSRLCK